MSDTQVQSHRTIGTNLLDAKIVEAKVISIVIVNYRTGHLVIECLRSIAKQRDALPTLQTVVVDNASGDTSAELLAKAVEQESWQQWVALVRMDRNGGFAFGSNVGIRKALSSRCVDYVMLLNPDTVVQEQAIAELACFMESRLEVGVAGSRLEDTFGIPQTSAHHSPSPLGELESSARFAMLSRILHRYAISPPTRGAAHRCDWVSGASIMIKRQVFEEIGFLDERYFLYFEEVDFCLRARRAGWEVWFVPNARVVHIEGASTDIANVARRRPAYWYESRRRFFVKHFGVLGLIAADVLWALGRMSLTLRRLLHLGRGGVQRDPSWYAFDLIWGDVRDVLSGRIWRA